MPQWAGSCWYYLRFIDPTNSQRMLDAEAEKYWMPVDLYVGGAEHAVLHLLYARFWHKVGRCAVLRCAVLLNATISQHLLKQSWPHCQSRCMCQDCEPGLAGVHKLYVVACRSCMTWVWSVTRSLSSDWSVRE